MKILVADDEPTSRLIAELALRGLGHECQTVSDGIQARDAYRSNRPDVVISDLIMPGLNGLDLCREIRAVESEGYTYFIVVTAQGARDQVVEGMSAGVDDYLIKPLDPDDLQARLIAAARVTSLHSQLVAQQTELVGLNRRLEESNDELRSLDQLKDEFVALVSHELRTPLTSIIGYINALERGKAGIVPVEQRKLLNIIDRNASRLVKLVNDLLLAAQADAGKLELEPAPIELAALVQQAVDSARPSAEEQGVRLELTLPGADTVAVFADQLRITEVLDNLVSNAVKFSPSGGVVEIVVSSKGPSAVIEVTDEGIGIPLAEQGQLFRRFFRASTATSREIQGPASGSPS